MSKLSVGVGTASVVPLSLRGKCLDEGGVGIWMSPNVAGAIC